MMTASCIKDFEGLIGGHAYTVLGVLELKDEKNQVAQQLISLRNAIGQEEFTGAWNNYDESRWSLKFRSQAQKGEGIFYMAVPEFK